MTKCQRCLEVSSSVRAYHGADDFNYWCEACANCACSLCLEEAN